MFKNRKPKLLDTTFVSEILKKVGQKQIGGKTKISELMEDFHDASFVYKDARQTLYFFLYIFYFS